MPPTVGSTQRESLLMVLDRIRWLYAHGWTEQEITNHLNDHDLRTPSWRRTWSQPSVSYWMRRGPRFPGRAA